MELAARKNRLRLDAKKRTSNTADEESHEEDL